MPSKPPSAQCSATSAYPATISSISACGDRLGHLAEQRIGDGRRPPDREARVHRRRLAAVVIDLGEDRHPMTVHGVGDLPVAGDDVSVEPVDQLLVRPVGRMGRVFLGDDQPGAARGSGAVVRGVLLGRQPVAGVVGEVRGEHDPVADLDRAELLRSPEIAIRHGAAKRYPSRPTHALPDQPIHPVCVAVRVTRPTGVAAQTKSRLVHPVCVAVRVTRPTGVAAQTGVWVAAVHPGGGGVRRPRFGRCPTRRTKPARRRARLPSRPAMSP